jgi:transcriptional regulator with XRE-family HTH domain
VTEATEVERVDEPNWQKILGDLIGSGMTQSSIAARLSVTQGTVSNLVTGRTKTVAWSIGQALLALHKDIETSDST